MQSRYFSALLPELAIRASRATVSRLGFSNPPLRRHLMKVFASGFGTPGSFLADPVFEATFGWERVGRSMEQLSPSLLHPAVVAAMDGPPGGIDSEYRFPRSAQPYTHQYAAWSHLLDSTPQSVVVTSGTGSGKTECFMVPILSKLAKERQERGRLVGVRALFLYPLNALIQSQRERLRAWTAAFGSDIRFCLYNGNTPDRSRADRQREFSNEVLDREALRSAPPPILVTNPTMLEYMLVRAQDAPILDASQGKLEWVVLDEAHNYMGSQAAELSLLLRRVLHAFGVKADQVRFIATSATMGNDPEHVTGQLQEYLAKLAGVDPERVHVVEGRRRIPPLSDAINATDVPSLDSLEAVEGGEGLNSILASHPVARGLREQFMSSSGGAPYRQLSAIGERVGLLTGSASVDDSTALRWLDVLTRTSHGVVREESRFLPLRLHVFHNTLNGLWACCDPRCPYRKSTDLDHEDWHFGLLYAEERRHCRCGAPVFPLASCNDCNATLLRADWVVVAGVGKLHPPQPIDLDEFTLELEVEDEEAEGGDATPEPISRTNSPVLIANGSLGNTAEIAVDRATCELDPVDKSNAVNIRLRDVEGEGPGALSCPYCRGSEPTPDRQFRKAVLGAPFLLGEIIPTLLEFCPDGGSPMARPMRGRRMITFTDSRQGTARIAARLQQDAERNSVRAAVYQHVVQSASTSDAGSLQELRARLSGFETLLEALGPSNPGAGLVRSQIEKLKEDLQTASVPRAIPFREMLIWLATGTQDIGTWIHHYYQSVGSEFRGSDGKEQIARILMVREFARRPKRVNSLETMGLVAVRYPKLDSLVVLAPAVQQAGFNLEEWRTFLKLTLDFHVRENTFVLLPDSWRKWGGNRIAAKQLLPPTSVEQPNNRLRRWPQCSSGGRQPRLVRMLSYVLKREPTTPEGRDLIDGLLRAAWDDLAQRTQLLQQGQSGRYLALEDLAFSAITDGWVCPATRRILDTTLRGVTPYLPTVNVHDDLALCREVKIPFCEMLRQDFDSEEQRIIAVREWVGTQPLIESARAEGLWSDLNDRILEGCRYFRTVEHSAQQSGAKLAEYEEEFKACVFQRSRTPVSV